MRIVIRVEAQVDRVTGKFGSKDDLAEEIIEAIEGANPDSLSSDGENEYEVTDWAVTREAALE